jgi:hypothetical protein
MLPAHIDELGFMSVNSGIMHQLLITYFMFIG